MVLKNQDIIESYEELSTSFKDNSKYLPAKISFIIQKNIKTLKTLSEEIYSARNNIIQHYGVQDEEDKESFIIPDEYKEITQKELDELIEMEQEVNILKLKFSDIENLEFTMNQMEALMFMIEEEVE